MKQYKTLSEWKNDNISKYNKAKRDGDIHLICEAMGWECFEEKLYKKWDKDKCIEDIKGCELKREWYANHNRSYMAAKKYGWFKEICELKGWSMSKPSKPLSYWTKELCIKEAKKYKGFGTSRNWRLGAPGSYQVARESGWLAEISALFGWKYNTPRGYWNKERCIEEAKKYKTKTEWKKSHSISYNSAKNNGWYEECTEHMISLNKKPIGYWTKDRCLKEALKYKTKAEWSKNDNPSHQAAYYNGWYEECTEHMVSAVPFTWTKELLYTEVNKLKTYTEFMRSGNLYQIAKKYGWVDYVSKDLFKTKIQSNYWEVKENILEEIKKYKTITEWTKSNHYSKASAKRNGWYEECKDYFKSLKEIKWNKEKCLEEAKKYKIKSEWCKGHNPTYSSARINGWYEECTKHMVILKRPERYWTKDRCLKEALKYKTKIEWETKDKGSNLAARRSGWYEECVKHMTILRRKNGFWDSKENCITECSKYNTKKELRDALGSYPISKIRENGWYEECTKDMK